MLTRQDVAKQIGTKVLCDIVVDGRRYVDSWTTPHGPLVSTPGCEHCDGERSRHVRIDALRGHICPPCDSALDEMFDERPPEVMPRRNARKESGRG